VAADLDADKLDQAARVLAASGAVAVLTGAGVSAESGVPTFRGDGGLWKNVRAEEVATPEAFGRDPRFVWEFYNSRREKLLAIRPNQAHVALAELESQVERFTLITQNVDRLHQQAGSRRVLEVHGNIWTVRCTTCGREFDKTGERLPELPACESCGGLLRPAVVWFHESLPPAVWAAAEAAARECDCLLVVGTSANVHPAAGLAWTAQQAGAQVIEVNLEPTPASEIAAIGLYGPAGQILPPLIARAAELRVPY
jgi:NAD-dependent deacetylase